MSIWRCPTCQALYGNVYVCPTCGVPTEFWTPITSSPTTSSTTTYETAGHEIVVALSPWLRHHPSCFRERAAGACDCGLQKTLARYPPSPTANAHV